MGAIQHLNLIRVTNLTQTIKQLKEAGYWIYASALTKQATNYAKVKYDKKVALIVGNEENGIGQLLIKEADFQVMIPMYGKIQSLNVSVATGILLAQIKQQLEKYENK
jgi:23S rRNA (guanosine2251-2'-O)-methyltransferase